MSIPVGPTIKELRAAYIEASKSPERLDRYARGLVMVVEVLGKELQAHGTTAKERAEGVRAQAFAEKASALVNVGQARNGVLALLMPPATAMAYWDGTPPPWLETMAAQLSSSILAHTIVELNAVQREAQSVWEDPEVFTSELYAPYADVLFTTAFPFLSATIETGKATIEAADAASKGLEYVQEKATQAVTGLWGLGLAALLGAGVLLYAQRQTGRGR